MCDICSGIYHSDIKHNVSACPVRASMYCSCCQIYGHSTLRCPDKSAWQTRVPEFIEQLIPPAVRAHHKITSQTPFNNPSTSPYITLHPPVLEVPEDKDGKFIRATLASHNLPSSGVKENKRVLEAFAANVLGKKVVYLQNEIDVAEKQAKKDAKKTLKIRKAL
jgi:hypothetical protein